MMMTGSSLGATCAVCGTGDGAVNERKTNSIIPRNAVMRVLLPGNRVVHIEEGRPTGAKCWRGSVRLGT